MAADCRTCTASPDNNANDGSVKPNGLPTISDYADALANPNGRFQTLDGIYGVRRDNGEPAMTLSELTADFETIWNGDAYTLRCLLRHDAVLISSVKEVCAYTCHIDCAHLTPHTYLEKEMLVFDTADNPVYVDVIMQRKPAGERLDARLRGACEKRDDSALSLTLRGLAGAVDWLSCNDFSHRNLCARNIIVQPDGTPVFINYTRSSRKRSREDLLALGALTAAVYIAACQPELYAELVHDKIMKTGGLAKLARLIADIMGDEDAAELNGLLAMIISGDGTDNDLCAAIARLADAKPRPYAALENIAAHLRGNAAGGDGMVNGAAGRERKYRFIGPMHDMVMRAFDGSAWRYIDKTGAAAVPGTFAGATDFAEGRAVVETAEGYGLIDLAGRFVIPPRYDDIEWDSVNNVAIVTAEGLSGLYSREGELLTGLIYDQILAGSEGLFPVRQGGKFGYLRRDGVMAIRPQYDDAFGFRGGVARVGTGNREFLIDTAGERVDDILMQAATGQPLP